MIHFQGKNKARKLGNNFSGRSHRFPTDRDTSAIHDSRRKIVVVFIMACMATLVGRAFDLQVLNKQFLKDQGDVRHVSDVKVEAYRGMIKDRNGAPLAISTPVESIWMNPQQIKPGKESEIRQMEKLLNLSKGKTGELIKADVHRQFAYIARQVSPVIADQVKALKIAGIYFEREFKRFYPAGEVSAHLVGFTNIDDIGQAGLESGYEKLLKGIPGSKRVIRDGQRRIIADVENIKEPIAGRNLELSIDQRIQYLAYRELQLAFNLHKAKSAALVVLDAKSGEILAAVNQPSFNPNTRKSLKESRYRNRSITDVFEPGSTIKPFVVAAALDGGYIKPDDLFETHGVYPIGSHVVRDVHDYGTLDLTGVLKKSSNVAVSQIALSMPPEYFWNAYHRLGFGVATGSGFPGEASGSLLDYQHRSDFETATLSFGYGVSASALQLARAYTALADNGILHSVSLLRRDEDVDAQRVFSVKTAKRVRAMMETVLMKGGTAYEARVDGYSAAGKTGTVKKAGTGGYVEKNYFSVFAGMAPAKNPRLIVVVMVDEPSAGQYYGGIVSAPVFSKVMEGALRVLEVAPDQQDNMPILLTRQES
ncbi:MAG: penicillin-binding transpeptidase domain-containing protein [Methylobacter sp.]|uniref:Peptidoglycan D,D-transpeptidase FtsI n=1 Tax=Candidatus Methylobacter titanis TaxID=3053457 RepID=A0AA43TKK3_9GAMM|nr:penicillin-binding transpeptidase domain-containing protein [Candidatus Methylobacter titanis]MDI1291996.1 penicillin-binding transpeptidase domain-containing protein [Candidatus Methylobacter titanis]